MSVYPRYQRQTDTHCACGRKFADYKTEMSTGYGVDRKTSQRWCFHCCGEHDIARMIFDGKATLYLSVAKAPEETSINGIKCFTNTRYELTNWPGSVKFPVAFYSEGRHNIAQTRTDVWFRGPDGHIWWGVQYGEWTQLCHCKRTRHTDFNDLD